MKKKNAKKQVPTEQATIFRMAGEAIGNIGHEIVEAKDNLVEISQAAADKFSSVKKAISKKIATNKIKPAAKKKAAVAKKTAKKVAKKVPKKTAKKTAKKVKGAAPKKAARKAGAKTKK